MSHQKLGQSPSQLEHSSIGSLFQTGLVLAAIVGSLKLMLIARHQVAIWQAFMQR
jgi:hypothetical protein